MLRILDILFPPGAANGAYEFRCPQFAAIQLISAHAVYTADANVADRVALVSIIKDAIVQSTIADATPVSALQTRSINFMLNAIQQDVQGFHAVRIPDDYILIQDEICQLFFNNSIATDSLIRVRMRFLWRPDLLTDKE